MATGFKKCPLCSGTVKNGICIDCGYRVPDEHELDNMSKLYDFDPDDYPHEIPLEETVKPLQENMPEGGYAGYAEPTPHIIPKAVVRSYNPPQNIVPPQNNYIPPQNAYTPPQNNYTPPPRNVNYSNTYGNGQNSGSGFKITANDIPWAELAVSLIFPIVGIPVGIGMMKRRKTPADKLFGTICIVLGFLRIW